MSVSNRWKKVAVAVGVVAALSASAGVGAWAQSGGGSNSGGGEGAPAPRAGVASPTESVYVPITPCRIVNTATSGAGRFSAGQTRAYRSQGNTSAQGGAASCGIPASASALEVNITAPLALGDGYLRVAPAGVAIPNATFLNYEAGFNASNAGTIRVTKGAGNNFQVRAFNAGTHVVVDVLGYYVEDLMAKVSANSTLNIGNGVVSTSKVGTGGYEVIFDRNVTGCAYTATLGIAGNPPHGTIITAPRAGQANGVFVETKDLAGAFVDRACNLHFDC